MANGPSHPNEQLVKKRSRGTAVSNGTRNRTAMVGPHEQVKEPPVARGSGPIGPHEQASLMLSADVDESFADSAVPKARARNGSGTHPSARRLRFNVSLQAKLAKSTDFTVCVFSPDRERGGVIIESIHVGVYRKGESVFSADLPIRREAKVDPGTKKVLSFSDAQKKELGRVVKSKSFAMVTAVYTAPGQTEVTFSIENADDKKK
ncbi:MAG: hypothetical protein ACJ74Y_01685 [Bryobacteraceae bacterium]